MELEYSKVYKFWNTHGKQLESEHGPDTFAYELVVKMRELHAYIVQVIDQVLQGENCNFIDVDPFRGKIQDILSLQKRHIIQFRFCLDDFNRYLTALGMMDVLLGV